MGLFSTGLTAVVQVAGMSCDHCVKAVTAAAKGVKGVKKAVVSLQGGTATITYAGEGVVDAVKKAITDAGFEAA